MLAVATGIGSVGLAAGGTAGALLGANLTGTEAAAGLPLGLLVVGQAIAALVVSRRTRHAGRGRSLILGYVLGALGAALVIFAAVSSNFVTLLAGSIVLGAGNAAIFLTRYAAGELGGEAARGRSLGVVLFATAFGAILSPNLLGPGGEVARMLGLPPLTGLYLLAILSFVISAILLAAISYPGVPYLGQGAALLGPREMTRSTPQQAISSRGIWPARVALVVLGATNLVMVSVMAVAPVHLSTHGHSLDLVGIVIGVHVAGMFVPSPVSGRIADRIGGVPIAALGILLLVVTGIAGALVNQDSVAWIIVVLAVLGIGWNLGIVGGSMLLAASVPPDLRPRTEGLGEVAMGVAAGVGAPIAGMVVSIGSLSTLLLSGAGVAALTFVFLRPKG